MGTQSPILSYQPEKSIHCKGQKLLPETRQSHGETSGEQERWAEILVERTWSREKRVGMGEHGRSWGLALPWEQKWMVWAAREPRGVNVHVAVNERNRLDVKLGYGLNRNFSSLCY